MASDWRRTGVIVIGADCDGCNASALGGSRYSVLMQLLTSWFPSFIPLAFSTWEGEVSRLGKGMQVDAWHCHSTEAGMGNPQRSP